MERFRLFSTINFLRDNDRGHGPLFRWVALTTFLVGFLILTPTWGLAQDIDQEELKRAFFMDLSDDQKVSLLAELDNSSQLTSVQLGAKYNWGYIPPDRRPPVSLARWWDNLNERQRRQERIEWFNNHFQQLNVERAARELGLRDRLSELYRQLEGGDEGGEMSFEKVSFPRGSLQLDTAQQATLPEEYERFQYNDDSADAPEEPTRRSGSTSEPETHDSQASSTPAESTDGSSAESVPEDTEPEKEQSSPQTDTSDGDGTDTSADWRQERHFEGGSVIFERVGDEVKASRRSTADTFLQTEPDYEYPVRSTEENQDELPLPALRFEDEVTSPQLRFHGTESADENSSPSVR